MKEFPKKYNHNESEQKWQTYWQATDVYKWDSSLSRDTNFVIDTPPPTVSGVLHMGHVFSYTQADFIARYQRMKGKNVFYPMGFDDNGLPTERLVEKNKKVRAGVVGRAEFRNLCMEVIEDSEVEFKNLFDSISVSVDWTQKYQTISNHSRSISQMSFLDLYEKNHVYRSLEPTIWDPIDRTALAQADLEDKEMSGIMHDVEFKTEDGESLKIATTRPELLPACVSVFYHPKDSRYTHLAGKNIITPVFGVSVPVLADDTVEMEKGTGLVMCCTFGDIADIEWWKTHKLQTRIILDHTGKIDLQSKLDDTDFPFKLDDHLVEVISRLDGKKCADARSEMVDILKEQGALLSSQEVTRMVKCAERSKSPIEILINHQWFIRVLDKKEQLLQKANECVWHPEFMKSRIENWINGLKWDWCISRQRYFGVPFPVWYSKREGEQGKVIMASRDELPVDPTLTPPRGYSMDEVDPETDIMDTWATSSVTPQINSHAINESFSIDFDRHQKLFCADLRPQSHEIIRTWAFSTIVKSTLHEDSIPWKNLMISGWVLAADKTKMSKSKGNIVTPIDLIHEKGSDVIRYWASSSKLGNDVAYSEDMFKIGKKLVTKLWNASKFVSLHLESVNLDDLNTSNIKCVVDKWLISKLHSTIQKATDAFEIFEYCNARTAVEDFFWNDFCDNYLELIKVRIYNEESSEGISVDGEYEVQNFEYRKSAIITLAITIEAVLKLFAPFLPVVTEELYEIIFDRNTSIHSGGMWPESKNLFFDKESINVGKSVVDILEIVRKFKTDQQISLKKEIEQLSVSSSQIDNLQNYFKDAADDLQNVTNAKKMLFNSKLNNNLNADFKGEIDHFIISIYK